MRIKKMLTVLAFFLLFFFLSACDKEENKKEKAIPVYQGMKVTDTLEKQMVYNSPLFFGENDNDTDQDDDEIDQEDPYDNFDGSTIEDEVENKLDVITSEDVEYYTTKNKDFYITVKLLNPDNFVILSFTLNGVFYQNYQFQDGSDSENLILKANSGDVSGIKDYTIDAIKYIDGTEIKDAIFAGDRTVKVGVTYDVLPYASTSNLKVDTTSISLNAQVADPANLIELYESPLMIYLYDGENMIKEKELVVGNNEVLFDKLKQDTLYQYAIVTSYDSLDGNGSQLVVLEKHAFYTKKMINLTNVKETQDSIAFDIVIDDNAETGSLTSIKLYKGTEEVKSLTDLTLREFTGLLSNNLYEIRVVYTYDLNDGFGEQTAIDTHQVTTKAKATPIIEIVDVVETQTSIEFDLDVEDTDSVGEITSIKLYKGTEEVKSLTDLTLREFTGLLSNNLYEIRVVYTYDLNDGVGERTAIDTHQVTTKAKATPTVEIIDVVETQISIEFDLDVEDTDSVGEITSIKLYKGTEEVKSLTDLTLREFTGLLSNNLYEIRVVYTYDLNDGGGARQLNLSNPIATLATPIEITGITILNNSYPKVGEEVHVQVFYENPAKLNIKAFYINEQKIDVVTSNTAAHAIFKFIPEFEGGTYDVQITAINYLAFDQMKYQPISLTYSDSILILGDVGILSIEEANGLDYFVKEEDNYLIINLDNPTGYDISGVVLADNQGLSDHIYDSTELEKIDNNTIKLKQKGGLYANSISVSVKSITYGIEGVEHSTKTISNVNKVLFVVNSLTIRNISTIEELQNMESGYAYQLVNDINAMNHKWMPYNFIGVLYGRGFEIKNLSIVLENESENQQFIALFNNFGGLIDGLGLVDAYISIKTKGEICLGAFIAKVLYYESYAEIRNSYVSGTTISINTNAIAVAGGFIGETNLITSVNNSYVNGTTINIITNSSVTVGGLVGNNTYINNINNSYVSGTTINVTTTSFTRVNGLIGNGGEINNINNSYIAEDVILKVNNESMQSEYPIITVNDLNSKSFYTNTLGWSEEIWNLDTLDYENGDYPTIK
jgi:ribosomal protein S13